MTEHPSSGDRGPAGGADALERLLDGLAPLAGQDDTRAYIAGARTAAHLLTARDAEGGDQ